MEKENKKQYIVQNISVLCIHSIGDILISENTNEIYELTGIGKRKCLVEVISSAGGYHEFERRTERVNTYKKYKH